MNLLERESDMGLIGCGWEGDDRCLEIQSFNLQLRGISGEPCVQLSGHLTWCGWCQVTKHQYTEQVDQSWKWRGGTWGSSGAWDWVFRVVVVYFQPNKRRREPGITMMSTGKFVKFKGGHSPFAALKKEKLMLWLVSLYVKIHFVSVRWLCTRISATLASYIRPTLWSLILGFAVSPAYQTTRASNFHPLREWAEWNVLSQLMSSEWLDWWVICARTAVSVANCV